MMWAQIWVIGTVVAAVLCGLKWDFSKKNNRTAIFAIIFLWPWVACMGLGVLAKGLFKK